MALVRIHEKPNAIPVNASVFAIETQVSGVWYSQKVTWEQLVGLVSALDNLQNYYKKSETYTKQEVQALIAQIPSFTVEVVQQLPTEDISTTTLYLVPKSTPEAQDYYEEYINLDGTTSGWEYVGTTQVDLSNYYTKTETEAYVKGDGADYIVGTKTFSTLTTTAKSILGAINEVAGAASSAQADATQALADASTAQGTANSASAAASAAQTTADAAATAAGNAASAASAAQTTANAAQTAAATAQTTADAAAAGLLLKEDQAAMPEDVADIIKQMKTPKTVIGNPVTFETVEETFAKGAELTFGPIQDLHGYDHPWAGGNGKNKIGSTLTYIKSANVTGTWSGNDYTLNGVTFKVLVDGDNNVTGIKVTGTASERTDFRVGIPDLVIGTDYILNGCPADGSDSTYRLSCLYNTNSSSHDRGNGSATFTATGYEGAYCYIRIADGYSIATDGLTYYPMLRLSTESDATFEPYSNICPISGRDSVDVVVTGKNLIDVADRTITSQTTIATGISLEAGTYTVSIQAKNNANIVGYFRITSGGATAISQITIPVNANTRLSSTFTIEEDVTFSIICNGQSAGYNYSVSDIMLEKGSTATAYEPYNRQTKTITFPSTIYGGTNEIVGGTGQITYSEKIKISDLAWTYLSSGSAFRANVPVKANGKNNFDAECFKVVDADISVMNNNEITGATDNNRVYVKSTDYTTVEDFLTAYGNNNIVVELATPTPFSTTPTPILLNAGTNVVSTDADTAAVTYTEMATLDDMRTLINAAVGAALNTEY